MAQIPPHFLLLLLPSISSLSVCRVTIQTFLVLPFEALARIWIRGSLSFYFFPVRLLSGPASEPQHTGPSHGRLAASAALSVNYALVHKKGVIVPAVCSDNERVNMSQVFWRKELTAAPQLRPHPSVSALSCPVAPLSPAPPLMVSI